MRELLKDSKNRLGLSALSANNPSSILEIPSTILHDAQTFNVAIAHEGDPVTNQRSSGRCWIFAATNVFRIAIQQKYDIKKFELSQAYLFYWYVGNEPGILKSIQWSHMLTGASAR